MSVQWWDFVMCCGGIAYHAWRDERGRDNSHSHLGLPKTLTAWVPSSEIPLKTTSVFGNKQPFVIVSTLSGRRLICDVREKQL